MSGGDRIKPSSGAPENEPKLEEQQAREQRKLLDDADLRMAVAELAGHYERRVGGKISQNDFFQSGMEGACKAAARYDPARGASFKTYAWGDIRGAMVRQIEQATRAQGIQPRPTKATKAADRGADKLLRDFEDDALPEDSDEQHVARLRDFSDGLLDHMSGAVVSESFKASAMEGPGDLATEHQMIVLLRKGLELLSALQRWLIDFVWFEDRQLKEAVGKPGFPNYMKVRRVYADARAILRAFLAAHGVFGVDDEGSEKA